MSIDNAPARARVAELRALAERVLESPPAAEQFHKTPHLFLDGQAQLALATTAAGAHRVETLLQHLEYSLPM